MTLTARPRLLIRFAVLAALALCGVVLALSSTGTPPVGAQDGSVPAKPTGVVATATHDSVALAWDDPGDASITHYQIFRRDRDVHDAGEFVTIEDDTGSAATSYADDTVEPERRYVYRVKAVNAHGASNWSDYRRANTPAAPDPADLAPSGLEVSLVENRVTLSWDAPASDAASVTGYEILRRRPNEGEAALTTLVADTGNAETGYTDDTANEPGVRYTYRVKALRDGEQSRVSNYARIDLPDDYAQDTSGSDEPTPTPEALAPSGLTAEAAKDGGVALSWTAPAEDAGSVTGYEVLRARGNAELATLAADTGSTDTAYADETATKAGETYAYQVKALRGEEKSQVSNRASITLPDEESARGAGDATGAPSISGMPQVGEQLTADPSNIGDPDGIADADFEYQWIAFDGTTDSDISGATGETYRPLLAHLAQTIKVRVSFDDDNDNAESLTSAATSAVTASTYGQVIWSAKMTVGGQSVGSITLRGFNIEAGLLIFGDLDPNTFAYDSTNITVSNLLHEVSNTTDHVSLGLDSGLGGGKFILYLDGQPFLIEEAGEQGSYILITFEDHGISWSNNQMVEVRLTVNRPATGAPSISGTPAVGETLTAGISGIMDDDGLPVLGEITYQWISDDSDIDGATDSTYTLMDADEGKTIKVRVSFTDNAKFPESLTSAATGPVTAAVAALVSNVGQTAAGNANVTASQSQGQGFTTGSDSGGYTLGSVELAVSSFSGTASDITVSIYSESSGDPGTLVHTLTTPASISTPVTTFTAPSDTTLAASTTYYVVISTTSSGINLGRTNATAEDTGGVSGWSIADSRRFFGGSGWNTTTRPIRMRVNGDAATSTNSPATGAPTISETAQVGELLTADTTTIGDPDGIDNADFEYQWIANDGTTDSDISGATGETYRPLLAHLAQTIKVRVSFDDDNDNAESLTSAATSAVTASTYGQVIWAATLTVEEDTVSAGTVFGYAVFTRGSLEPISFTHDGITLFVSTLQYIEGDTLRFYFSGGALGSEDFNLYLGGAPFLIESPGSDISLSFSDHGLTWTDEQEVEVRLTVNRAATGAPAITGKPEVGETLTAGISGIMDDDGLPVLGEITYQWISDDSDIDGATDSTYTLMDADEGKSIKVRVSFTDNAKFPESLTSAATGPVTAAVAALVSNVGQTAAGNANVTASQSQGQGFTTGSDSGGYTLGSVELAVSSFSGTASDITVSIYSESSGHPGTVVHTLTTPASISTPVTTFTAPSGTTLAASTTYYLVISTTGSGINLSRTNATAEDTGGVSGWSIADSGRVFAANAWRTTTSPIRVRVNGAAATTTSTGIWSATLTVAIGGSFYGYSGIIDVGDLEPAEFTYNGNPATVQVLAYSGNVFYLQTSPALDSGDYRLFLDDTPIQLGAASGSPPRHQVSDHGLTWTTDQQVEVRLALNNEPTGEPVITGTPEVSQTLTADISGIMDTDGRPADDQFFYQWIRSDGATDSDISGATNATYKLGRADLGKTIKVRVTFTDGGGFPETLTSDATGPVTHLTVSSDWSLTPSSLNPGDRFRLMFLTTSRNATPKDIDVYNEWVQNRAAGGHVSIREYAGVFNLLGCTEDVAARDNTGTTYTDDDKGVRIYWLNGPKVADDYEDLYDGGWDEEAKMRNRGGTERDNPEYVWTGCGHNGAVSSGAWLGHDKPTIGLPDSTEATGGPLSSSLITANAGFLAVYALSDVFEVAVPTTDVPVNWSLVPSGLQRGDQFRLLFISSSSRNASPTSIATYNTWIQDRVAAGHTDIQGYSSTFNVVGSTAAVDARDNTGTTYTSGSSYKGVPIYWLNGNKVADQYEDFYDGSWDEEASMRTQAGTSRAAPQTLWTGSGHNGTEARTGNNNSRALGNSDVATGRPNDSNSGLGPLGTAQAWSSEKGVSKQFYGLSGVFRVVAVANTPATGKPTISGTPQVNQTLTADISSIMDADGLPAAGQFSYQWISDDGTGDSDIDGATDSTYTLVFADYGNTIKVRVSFTDDNDYPESLTSTAVGVASPYGDVIHSALLTVGIGAFFSGYSSNTNTGVLEPANFTHNGNSAVVQVLAYSVNEFYFQTLPALGSGDYALFLDDTPVQLGAASGSPLRHQVSDHGLTWTADQQVEVWLVLNNEPTGKPTISGTPQVNLTLTADISSIMDADGLPAAGQFSYQWISDDSDIDGATGSTYTLVEADAGKTIKVRVSFTDSSNFPESLTSAPTVAVLEMVVPEVPADWSLAPSGLVVGDQFRLLFVSSTGRDATSDIIATYNTWIQNLAAAGHTDIQRYYSTFTVVGSTAAVDAQDNTHTTYTSSDKGVPIYWLNGNKVADQYEDFYDGSWDDEANRKTEAGTASSDTTIRTGSDPDGTEKGFGAFSLALGKSLATVGIPDSSATGSGPLSSDTNAADSSTLPLYGLSGVFTVVAPPPTEVPSTWSLIPSGLGVGDEFRLLFVSSTTRTPQATGIGTYNTYVQNRAAAGHTDIRDYSDTFRVVGCTDARDARDNTYTTYTSSDKGVPIYWLNGNKVVDQYEDFYDGSWDDQANPKTEAGTSTSATTIWTGCDEDGTEAIHIGGTASRALGTFSVAFGDLDHATLGPVGHPNNIGGNALSKPFYGLSAVFRVGQGPPTVVPADWSLIPSGLGAGQEFRLLFLSSTKRSIRSTNISDYNTFVQNRAAAGHTDIQDYSDTFRVLGSTGAKDARDNTGTTYTSSDKGVRIYWLNGDKAADQYEDFYDGSWDQQADAWNESGVEYNLSARRYVATGSSKDGTTDQSNPLGASSGEVQLGCLYQTSSINGPVSCNFTTENISADNNQQLYGLSGVFQVTTNNATGKPVITGTPEVRQTLTADISGIMDEDGLPADDQFSYQWIRSDGTDDSDISGATNATYKLKAADQGKTIKVKVTFTDEGGTEETLTSDATTAVAADTTGPVVEEVICFDSFCNLVFDELLDENLNNVPLTVAFAITADGAAITVGIAFPLIDGRFQVSSLAPQIRQGQTVKVKYTDPTSGDDTKAIQDAAGNDAADFATGEDDVPDVTNDSTLAPVAPGAPTGLTATPNGATQIDLTWTAPADNGGHSITGYQIEYSDDGGTSWSVLVPDTQSTDTMYSDTTLSGGETRHYRVSAINSIGIGAASNNPPTGKPAITGTPEVNQTLTADVSGIMDADGLPAADQFSYQWVRNDGTDDSDISGATDSTYKLEAADQGKTIKVRVTFTDEGGTEETLTSDATTAVAADTTGPVVEQVICDDGACSLFFDELIDGNVPPTNAFAITADAAAITVGGVFPLGDGQIRLTSLAPQIYQGQTVKIVYTDPTGGDDTRAIQDAAGNDAADFTTGEDGVPAVTNNSTLAPPPLVSNIGQTAATGAANVSTTQSSAQGFTTGTNSGGYTLDSVELAVTPFDGTASDITVSIYSESSGDPGTLVHTLTTPGSLSDPATTFTAPSGATLAASTTYYVVASTTNTLFLLSRTEAAAEDTGGASGWSIADDRRFSRNLVTWTTATVPIRMRINGAAATSATSTDATLSSLVLNDGTNDLTLTPNFASGTRSYMASVTNAVSQITVTPTKSDSDASVEYLDGSDAAISDADGTATGQQVALEEGENTIKVKVTAEDDATTGTYTVVVTRQAQTQTGIWSATVTPGALSSLVGWWDRDPDIGAITDKDFTYDGVTYSVKHIRVSSSGGLQLSVDQAFTATAIANLVLDVDGSQFPLSDSTGSGDDSRNWNSAGLSWTVGTDVALKMLQQPSTTPSAPTNVQASGNAELVVTWDAPDDGGSAITGYTVQWKSGTQSYNTSRQATVTTTTNTIGSLTNDTTYTLRVKATNANGDSGWTEITATPASGPGVGTVTSGSITQTTAVITVTIANPDTNTQTVNLQYKRNADTNWTSGGTRSTVSTAVTFNLTGLTGNTEYEVEASLDSTFDSGVKTAAFTTSPTKPGKTRSVAIGVGNGLLPITWTPPLSDGGSAITGYTVQWKSGSQSFGGDPSREHTTTGASVTAYFITGLTNGTEYTVRVIAVNAVGDGPPSDEWTQTPVGPPDAPPNVQAGSGHEQLTVSWGAPNDRGSAITEYRLQWKSPGQSFNSSRQRTIAAPSRTDTIPSLTNGTEYTVRVRATNALGNSGWSAEAKGTPREGPHVSTVRVKEPISCTVSFVALEFVNLDTATEYQAHLRFRAQGSSSWTVLSPRSFWSSGVPSGAAGGELNGPSPAFTLTDLAYETTYEVQAALDSGFVDGLAATTFSTPNLSEVGLMPLSPGDGTLGLRMSEPDSGGQVVGYLVQWKSGDEEYDDTDTSERQADVPGSGDREYTITGLDNGVEYTVRAMAYNDNGIGVPTIDVKGTPEAPPNSPARGAPTISGTAQVGETLTADTDGIEDDDGLDDAVYSYQWLADGADISGATGETYTPAYDDERKVISVKVSFTDDRDFEETLTSEPTAEVEADPDAPTEPPNAPRTVRIVGDTNTSLTLTWDAPDGGTAVTEYRVQWLTVGENFATARRDGREAVLGASARSHTITGLTKWGFYQVRVLAVNGAGESEGSNTAWGFPGLGEDNYGP